ncbi:MAG: PDZ domain-containing protein, partial [Chloroflexi bacterium]|nr:PDZ domain-containing protein [Chloroflexota bacterium]
MRKLIAGSLIALAFLALTAVIVSQSLPTQASDESSKSNASVNPLGVASVSSGDAPSINAIPPRPQARALGMEAEKQPFIGVTIETLDEGEAAELDIAGGAVVRSVLEDGPSAGLLQVDDIITHIDGNEMTSVRDVVEAVKASETGDVLSFTVIR